MQSGYKIVWIASLIAGLAIYVRPMGLFALPIFLAPLLIANVSVKRKLYASIIMILVTGMLLLPWMARNKSQAGSFTFTSLKSYNLVSYNLPIFLSLEKGTSIEEEANNIIANTKLDGALWRNAAYSKQLGDYATSIILSNPISYARFHIISSLPFFFASPITNVVEAWYDNVLRKAPPLPPPAIFLLSKGDIKGFFAILVSNLWYTSAKFLSLVILLAACYGIWINRGKTIGWAFAFVVIYLGLLAGPVANIRYRLPVEPMILVLATEGLLHYGLKNSRKITQIPIMPSR